MGQGITIHTKDCTNIANTTDRLIDVKWNNELNNYYYSDIEVEIDNGKNHLLETISLIAANNINVEAINSHPNDLSTIYNITLKISSKEDLESLIRKMSAKPYIKKIERIKL